MRDINQLHPELINKVYELVEACSSQGIGIGISECLRTQAEQDALYAKGRTAPGAKVTNCKGSTYSSMHQWGVAFDFYLKMDIDGDGAISDDAYNDSTGVFSKVGEIGKSIGLEWGGGWKSIKDKPHFQLPTWGSTATKLKSSYGNPEVFMKTWSKKAEEVKKDGSYGTARVIATSGVNLRSTPTTKESNKITTIPYKSICRILNTEEINGAGLKWLMVEYDGKQGYAAQKYFDIITYVAYEIKGDPTYSKNIVEPAKYRDDVLMGGRYRTTANLNLRTGGRTRDTGIILTIPKGDTVTCYGYYAYEKPHTWLFVEYKKYVGYVSIDYLTRC